MNRAGNIDDIIALQEDINMLVTWTNNWQWTLMLANARCCSFNMTTYMPRVKSRILTYKKPTDRSELL